MNTAEFVMHAAIVILVIYTVIPALHAFHYEKCILESADNIIKGQLAAVPA